MSILWSFIKKAPDPKTGGFKTTLKRLTQRITPILPIIAPGS